MKTTRLNPQTEWKLVANYFGGNDDVQDKLPSIASRTVFRVYAATEQEARKMCKAASKNIRFGGRFPTHYLVNSAASKPSRRNPPPRFEYALIDVPKDGPGYLHDASINTKGWIDAKLGSALSNIDWPSGEQPEWDNSPEILEYLEQREGREYKLEFRDNVYNSENDFNQVFTFSVYIPAESEDWIYEDGAYVALCLHKGGDTRGNYTFASLYKPREALGESGFTDWVLGWNVTDGKGKPIASADRYQVGYSNNPTSELNRFLEHGKDAHGLWESGVFYFKSKAVGRIIARADVR